MLPTTICEACKSKAVHVPIESKGAGAQNTLWVLQVSLVVIMWCFLRRNLSMDMTDAVHSAREFMLGSLCVCGDFLLVTMCTSGVNP